MKKLFWVTLWFICNCFFDLSAQDVMQAYNRPSQSLNGQWRFIMDPYETGYRNHRNWVPFDVKDYGKASAKPYWTNKKPENPSDRVEYDFDTSPLINVPGDWNHQKPELLYYEGTAWYKTDFKHEQEPGQRVFLYFSSSNYETDVYLNGEKLGKHQGGFDPFMFEITQYVKANNFLIVRVDNKRKKERVPNLTTDWWNYGGLTGDIKLISVPETYIKNYHLQLDLNNPERIKGYVALDGNQLRQTIAIRIPEIGINETFKTNSAGYAEIDFSAKNIKKWYPDRPKLYRVDIIGDTDKTYDDIGFRTIKTKGTDILLNGQSIFLRGISLHAENPSKPGRVTSPEECKKLMEWAEELNCNFIRLAHYPHSEHMARLADEKGIMLWEEIPVYWGIDYENEKAYDQAVNQLKSLVHRDKNRSSVIIWSMANETPNTKARLDFLKNLKKTASEIDPNRLISAALERDETPGLKVMEITDPFASEVDLLSCNEYVGWYGSTPDECAKVTWDLSEHNKPFCVSEFGGGALYNHHGVKEQRWTEEYQKYLYEEQLKMLRKIPSLRGMTPWILVDFRSPRRNLPIIQEGWNRKGLISNQGYKKQAFYVLKQFYDEMEKKYAYTIKD